MPAEALAASTQAQAEPVQKHEGFELPAKTPRSRISVPYPSRKHLPAAVSAFVDIVAERQSRSAPSA